MQEILSIASYFEWRGLCVGSCRQTPRVPLIYMPPVDRADRGSTRQGEPFQETFARANNFSNSVSTEDI